MDDADHEIPPSPPGGHRALIENFPNGVIVLFDADLRYRVVGPDTLPFSKREAEAMVEKTVHELFPEHTVAQLEGEFRATLDGHARSFDVEYDERVHHLEIQPTEIDGEPFGVMVTQEVTAERQTAGQLEQQNERLDQFASMISHDLRNPLTVAQGHLDLYRETGDLSNLESVEKALVRMEELTTDLTTLARHGTLGDEREAVSLADVATKAWEIIDSRSATLTTQDCSTVGSKGQLQALFENLFRNAVGHGGADVTVRVGPLAVGFYVEDTGSGIPPEDRDRVFDHGYTTGYSGSGIGLTIVHRIASDHGYEVSLSESEEGGARFEFRETTAKP